MKKDFMSIDLKKLAELLQNEVIDYCNICANQNKYVACKKLCTNGIAKYLRDELADYTNNNAEVANNESKKHLQV